MFNKFKNAFYNSLSSPTETDQTPICIATANQNGDGSPSNRKNHQARGLARSTSLDDRLTNASNDLRTQSDYIKDGPRLSTLYRRVISHLTVGASEFNNQIDSNHGTDIKNYAHSSQISANFFNNAELMNQLMPTRTLKFKYSRPEFLQLKTDDEIKVSADHQIRPIILPQYNSHLPWDTGYAECINAGKSATNEDQAVCYQSIIPANFDEEDEDMMFTIPWTYFAVFDGHAGNSTSVAVANTLHMIVFEELKKISTTLLCCKFPLLVDWLKSLDRSADRSSNKLNEEKIDIDKNEVEQQEIENGLTERSDLLNSKDDSASESSKDCIEKKASITGEEVEPTNTDKKEQQNCIESDASNNASFYELDNSYVTQRETNHRDTTPLRLPSVFEQIEDGQLDLSPDELIYGALEEAFIKMDDLIEIYKLTYKMPGGCTATVCIFLLDKLYVANAGDSRAIVSIDKIAKPMSFDFTPNSERDRICKIAHDFPEYLGDLFTSDQFVRSPQYSDIGKEMLYRAAGRSGLSVKTITDSDLKFPVIAGKGKRSRVLGTIGVTRGFGDHELRAIRGTLPIKPFLSCQPDIKRIDLSAMSLTEDDVLIIGTDGFWDVTSNKEAAKIVEKSFSDFASDIVKSKKYRYVAAAQDLIVHARGSPSTYGYWFLKEDGSQSKLASLDDISVFVVPLKNHKDEYIEWRDYHASKLMYSPENDDIE